MGLNPIRFSSRYNASWFLRRISISIYATTESGTLSIKDRFEIRGFRGRIRSTRYSTRRLCFVVSFLQFLKPFRSFFGIRTRLICFKISMFPLRIEDY
jgi:hypothetical protein